MYAFMYVSMHVFQVSTPLSLYINLTYVTEQTWLPHCKYDSYVKWVNRPNIFEYTC